jgi:2-keto-4-pentenoate hydratase/2-oxohepta-3-ene-1,7-dioic acid hydratase in catechol pathway
MVQQHENENTGNLIYSQTGFIAEMSAFYCRAFLSGDMCVAGTPHHTGLHSGYPGPMPISAGG